MEEEAKWQSNTRRLIREGVHSIDDPISWVAFHSNQEPPHDFEVTIGSLLPLFPECPGLFALDHTHYSRWVPIHIRDMMTLQEQHPDTAIQFSLEGSVVHKTKRPFSSIAIDQAHKQNNKVVKKDGGAVGLLQNTKSLHVLRWMVAGPKLARVIRDFEFEDNCLDGDAGKTTRTNLKLHEHTASAQVKFDTEVGALVQVHVLEDMRNPFMEESEDLLALDSREVAGPAIVQTVREIAKTGQDQYDKDMTE